MIAGQLLGAFRIGDRLGAGGMGEVYRARDTKRHREVAIKIAGAAMGRELYYVALDGQRMAVPITVRADGRLGPNTPSALFPTHIGPAVPASFHQQYAVSADGQAFFRNNVIDETTSTPITVLLNWHP